MLPAGTFSRDLWGLATHTRCKYPLLPHTRYTADPVFTTWAAKVADLCARVTIAEMQFYRNSGLPNVIYTNKLGSIKQYTTEEPRAESTIVREQWVELNLVMSSGDIMETYSRLASIETNLLEDVFQPGGKSLTWLVRATSRFFLGVLQHTAEISDLKDSANIISVLRGVQKALYVIRDWCMHKTAVFSTDLLLRIYQISMATDRIRLQKNTTTNFATRVLTPLGEWRQTNVCGTSRFSNT